MIEEVINSIVEAEKKADEIEKQAKSKSNEILLHAEQEAQEIIKKEEKDVADDIKKAELEAEKIIDKKNKEIIDKANKEALCMRENCFAKMVEAKDVLKRGLLEKYGCR